jgi:hypothetical protein
MQSPQLDKYARCSCLARLRGNQLRRFSARVWQQQSVSLVYRRNPRPSCVGNVKAALICEGMTVFNPVVLKSLDLMKTDLGKGSAQEGIFPGIFQ